MLQIKKTGNKNFTHYWVTANDMFKYIASNLTVIVNEDYLLLRSLSGAVIFEKKGYLINEVEVYDIGGNAETFSNFQELIQRLINLGYNAFYEDGEIVLSTIISTDVNNAIVLGSDGLLYASSTGGGGVGSVDSVTGDGVDNTDPQNPVLSFPTPAQINLGNVDNTSDANKPVSTAQQTALDLKADITYVDTLKPIQTADTSTTISLAYSGGNYCNMAIANATTTYTTTGSVLGGNAIVLINVATEPTITGATKIAGSDFEASTNMYLKVWNNGNQIQYWFEKIAV